MSPRAPARALDLKPGRAWSPVQLFAFRYAFSISVLSACPLLAFTLSYVPFQRVERLLEAVFARWDALHFWLTSSVGALILHPLTAGRWTMHDLIAGPWDSPIRFWSDLLGRLVLPLFAAALWTLLDRHRTNYTQLYRALRVCLRYAVGIPMLGYGMDKVIPNQFGILTPGEMLRPLGQLSHFQLTWDFMAASAGYTVFSGLVEVLGSVLLFFRRTTLAGSLILAAALLNIVALDLGNRVGPGHVAALFLLLVLILLAPSVPGLLITVLGAGQIPLPLEPAPARTRWYHSGQAKAVFLGLLLLDMAHQEISLRHSFFGAGRPVQGLFDVAAFVRNGQIIQPLANDNYTWKRVAADGRYSSAELTVQMANGDLHEFQLSDDVPRRIWTISEHNASAGTLNYAIQPGGDVVLEGSIGANTVHILLHPVDLQKAFPLLTP